LERCATSHPSRQLGGDLPVRSRFTWWIGGFIDLDDAPFQVRRRTFIFAPDRAWQHDIGALGGLGEKEVHYDERIELLERALDDRVIRQRDHQVSSR
jgi:hypothetical protein